MREKRPSFFFSSAGSFFFFFLLAFGGGASAADPGLELAIETAVDALELAADDLMVLVVDLQGKCEVHCSADQQTNAPIIVFK